MLRERERERREREYEREQQERQRKISRLASAHRQSGAIDIPLDSGETTGKSRVSRLPGEPEYTAPEPVEEVDPNPYVPQPVAERDDGLDEDLLDLINRADSSHEFVEEEPEQIGIL